MDEVGADFLARTVARGSCNSRGLATTSGGSAVGERTFSPGRFLSGFFMVADDWGFTFGSIDFGSIDFGSIAFGSLAFGSIAFGSIDFGSINFGSIAFSSIAFGSTAFGSIAFGSIAFGSIALGAEANSPKWMSL
jgi:hypothetical protein